MCKHVSLRVSVFESLSAYLYVCIFHIFNNLLYSIPCLSLATKTLTSSHLLILTSTHNEHIHMISSNILMNIFMQVFGVCKSYNYITHLSTYTPTRSQANHRLVDENPIRSHEIPAFFPSNPLPGLHGAPLVPGAIGRVQRRLRRTFGFTFVVLVCMAIIAARRGILAVEMLFFDMGKIRIFFYDFLFFWNSIGLWDFMAANGDWTIKNGDVKDVKCC